MSFVQDHGVHGFHGLDTTQPIREEIRDSSFELPWEDHSNGTPILCFLCYLLFKRKYLMEAEVLLALAPIARGLRMD